MSSKRRTTYPEESSSRKEGQQLTIDNLVQRHEVLKRLEEEPKSRSELWMKNQQIYQLYVDVEHTRQTLLEKKEGSNDDDDDKKSLKSLNRISDSLKLDTMDTIQQDSSLSLTLLAIPRTIVFIWTIFLGGILSILISPLRLFHPFLRTYCNIPNGKLPVDIYVKIWMRCICTSCGIQVTSEIIQKGNKNNNTTPPQQLIEPTLLMFSHVSNLDVFCLLSSSPMYCKFIGKSILFLMPIFGWAAYVLGTQPINRKNRSKAVQDLHNLQRKLQKWGRSLAISPEGTRSKTGLLAKEFKKGPFYLWEDCNHPTITPAIIFGAYELWSPSSKLPQPGFVVVRYCQPIQIDVATAVVPPSKNTNKDSNDNDTYHHQLREKARRMTHDAMLNEFKHPPPMPKSRGWLFGLEYVVLVLALVGFTRLLNLALECVSLGGEGGNNHWNAVVTALVSIVTIDLALYIFVIH